jgi:hypothetical protein
MVDSEQGRDPTSPGARGWHEIRKWSRHEWAAWSLASFAAAGVITSLVLAVSAPVALLQRRFWIDLLGFVRLQAAQPGVLHRAELRDGLLQIALAFLLLTLATVGLARCLRPPRGTALDAVGTQLRSPWSIALLAYVGLWLHVVARLLTEQNFESHTYVHQAAAWLRGELHVDRTLHDTIVIEGRRYAIFPPFPALVLLPWVALFGASTKTLLLTPLLGAVTAYASVLALRRLQVPSAAAAWCTVGLIFGTPLTSVSSEPVDTYFAHCCAVACGMCAFCETTGRCRGWLVGLLLGAAVLSRQLTILSLPFFVAAVAWPNAVTASEPPLLRGKWEAALGRIASLLLPLVLCLGAYAMLNWARSGDWLDTGYRSLVERGWYKYRAEKFGDFHWAFVPSNLLRLLLLGPGLEFAPGSYMLPTLTGFGSSLTFTSPFLYFALRDLSPRSRVWPGVHSLRALAWLCVGATTIAVLMHKSALGGWQGHGLRYTLDFTPLLFPLAALGIGRCWNEPPGLLARVLIAYSIAIALVMLHVIPWARRALRPIATLAIGAPIAELRAPTLIGISASGCRWGDASRPRPER